MIKYNSCFKNDNEEGDDYQENDNYLEQLSFTDQFSIINDNDEVTCDTSEDEIKETDI